MFRSLRVALFLVPKSIVRGNLGISALTVCMLAIVAMNLLFVPGLINGIVDSSNTQLVTNYTGDLIIESRTDTYISNASDLLPEIRGVNGVVAASARNTIGAKIEYGDARMNCNIIAVNPLDDANVFDISKYVTEGKYLGPSIAGQILLGMQIAGADNENIELYSSSLRSAHTGDNVTVTFANGVQRVFEISGIFYTKFLQADVQAFITDKDFQSIVPGVKDGASSINLKLDKRASSDEVIKNISALNSGLKLKTWTEMAGIVRSMTDSFKIIKEILDIVNILIAGITVFIVTYVDVVNRKRQIGIQRAIGIKRRSITLAYVFRAIFYALLGLLVGFLVYKFVVIPVETQHPFTFPLGPAYLSFDLFLVGRTILILVVVSIVASFMPVLRVMRKTILDSIWG
jgi:putative ABC transport system permease protein